MAKKFYVVWVGRETGVFTTWAYTKKQVDHFPQARYKSFKTQAEAEAAYASGKKAAYKEVDNKEIRPTLKETGTNQADPTMGSNNNFDVTIYCDGACDPNPGQAGSGVAVYLKKVLTELWYGLYNPKGTNNTAELNALHQALRIAKKNIDQGKEVQILCDSQYTINCVTVWAFSWKNKGWKRKTAGDIKNLEIIQGAHGLYEKIRRNVVVSHVKAHCGIEGNELADRMSVVAINQKDPNFCRYSEPLDIQKILDFRTG